VAYHKPQQPLRRFPHPTVDAQWRAVPPPGRLNVLPGLTLYFPPRQMAHMRATYTRARKADPHAYPDFQYFVLARVTAGLAERCILLAPAPDLRGPQMAGEFLATQLQMAACQVGVHPQTLIYALVAPDAARREQRWQAVQAFCARGISARWGRRGCATSLVGLGAVGLVICGLLGFAEAVAALLLHHPR
jgi:hypothetical protein